jgi:hypothetical protein
VATADPTVALFVRLQVPEGEMPCVRRIGRTELGQQLLEVGLDFGEGEVALLSLLNACQGHQKQQGLVRRVPSVRPRSPSYAMEQLSDLICAKGFHGSPVSRLLRDHPPHAASRVL